MIFKRNSTANVKQVAFCMALRILKAERLTVESELLTKPNSNIHLNALKFFSPFFDVKIAGIKSTQTAPIW